MNRPRLALLGLLLPAATLAAAQGPFRSSASSVVVDVSVTQNGRPVSDLTARDFKLTDNGVPQTVSDLSLERLPIDMTFIADLSGSVEGPLLNSFRRALDMTLGRLGAGDRARLVVFDPRIREIDGLESGRIAITAEDRPFGGGASALLDAVATSLIRPEDPDRRRAAIVFTDGQDAGSFLDAADVIDVAKRSTVTVFVVAITDGTTLVPQRPAHAALLDALAETTGGTVTVLQRDGNVGALFTQALGEFRRSYLLRYTPQGALTAGWHSVAVQLTRAGRFELRARKGYFVDAALTDR